MDRSLLGLLSARNPASPFAMSSHSRDISRSPSLTPTRSQLCFSWCLTCCLPGEQLSLLFRGEGEFTVHFFRYAARPCVQNISALHQNFPLPASTSFPAPISSTRAAADRRTSCCRTSVANCCVPLLDQNNRTDQCTQNI